MVLGVRNFEKRLRNCRCYGNNDVSKWRIFINLTGKRVRLPPFLVKLCSIEMSGENSHQSFSHAVIHSVNFPGVGGGGGPNSPDVQNSVVDVIFQIRL